jgi:hypothetical protein
MPDEDKQQPSLEPPKLFGRKKKKAESAAPARQPHPREEPEAAIPEPEPVPEPAPRPDPVPEPPPVPEPVPEPPPVPEPVPEPPPAPEPTPAPEPGPRPDDEQPAAEESPTVRTLATGVPLFADERAAAEDAQEEPTEPERGRWSRHVPRGLDLTGYPASALTGLVVGALMVGFTAGSLRACEGIRGTSTCGGPGLLLLVAILMLLVITGQALLRLFQIPDPGSTSFLAVGLLAVVALLFLIDVILDWTMIIVIPLLGVGAFLASHWVTTAFVEPSETARPSPPQEPPGDR